MFWLRNKKINFLIHTLDLRPAFLFLFSAKMFVIRAGIHKMLVNRKQENRDQTASSVWSGSALFI